MAHECLYLATRPGPVVAVGSSSVLSLGEPEWAILMPAGSIYVGKALRFRASGSIVAAGAVSSNLRCGVAHYTSAPVTNATAIAYFTHLTMSPKVAGAAGVSSWMLDWTMVCRTVGITTTGWFCHAIFASDMLINAGGTAGTQTTGTPVVNPIIAAPAVSTVKHTNVADIWLVPAMHTNGTGTYFVQMQNYRVDLIA